MVTLPPDLGRCHQLEELLVAHNALIAFPEELCSLPKLHVLDLSYNNLREIPLDIADLPELRALDLSENPELGMIPSELHRNAPMVQWLCDQRREQEGVLRRMQAANDELEALVRSYDLEKIALREEVSRLRAEQREVLAQQPEGYMRTKRALGSMACVLQ